MMFFLTFLTLTNNLKAIEGQSSEERRETRQENREDRREDRREERNERREETRDDQRQDNESDDKENPFTPYIQQRREIMTRLNQHVFSYCSQALINICDKDSIPVIPESAEIRRKVRFKNDANLHQYYSYVQGKCIARIQRACEETPDKKPYEYETKIEERREARKWYADEKKLRAEFDRCETQQCRDSVRKDIEKNNKERSEEKLTHFLNKKHRACLEWEMLNRAEEAIKSIDDILKQMKYKDAELLSFSLPQDQTWEIPADVKNIYCKALYKDQEEKSGRKPKDQDEDHEDEKERRNETAERNRQRREQNRGDHQNDQRDEQRAGASRAGMSEQFRNAASAAQAIANVSANAAQAAVTLPFNNNFSLEADLGQNGALAFARPTVEQKNELKNLSDNIQKLAQDLTTKPLGSTCSEASDCGIVQTQVNTCGDYAQTIAINQTDTDFTQFQSKIFELNQLSKQYLQLRDQVTGLSNRQYCLQNQKTPMAGCVQNKCVVQ